MYFTEVVADAGVAGNDVDTADAIVDGCVITVGQRAVCILAIQITCRFGYFCDCISVRVTRTQIVECVQATTGCCCGDVNQTTAIICSRDANLYSVDACFGTVQDSIVVSIVINSTCQA